MSLFLSIAVLAFMVPAGELRAILRSFRSGIVLAFALGALLVVSAIYYVAIRWAFGWYAKLAAVQRV